MTLEETVAIAYLRQPQAIRDRCQQLFDLGTAGQLAHFACDLSQLDTVAQYVVETTQQLYPDFDVPFHSRWRHFDAGGHPATRPARSSAGPFVGAGSGAIAARSRHGQRAVRCGGRCPVALPRSRGGSGLGKVGRIGDRQPPRLSAGRFFPLSRSSPIRSMRQA